MSKVKIPMCVNTPHPMCAQTLIRLNVVSANTPNQLSVSSLRR